MILAKEPSASRSAPATHDPTMERSMPKPLDILPGTLELLVMKTLADGDAMHGFDILRWLRETSDDALVVEEGSLYPALHRMERRGWLDPEWGISDRGRRAKYYRLTRAGQEELSRQAKNWTRYVRVVDKVFGARAPA